MTINNFPHEDKEGFQAAIVDAANNSGFAAPLIEKDYYCSLILQKLYAKTDSQIVFKGGTLLNKVYMGFYRLSEDLDFSISISPQSSRKERSNKVKPFKATVEGIAKTIPELRLIRPLSGSNNSTQYNARFEYDSPSSIGSGTISFEIGLREETLLSPVKQQANTLVVNPLSDEALVAPFNVVCLSQEEAYAEKLRAALARLKPAIRDLFDINYALNSKHLDVSNNAFKDLVKLKLANPVPQIINLSNERKLELIPQVQTHLKPVLRTKDFDSFNFEPAWQRLCEIGNDYL